MALDRLFGNLQLDAGRPIYQQIIEAVRRAMARGDLQPGDKLPSQRELASQIQVNPNTIQHAYRELEYMGMVRTARGQGTFVTEYAGLDDLRSDLAREAIQECLETLRQLGVPRDAIVDRIRTELEARETRLDNEGLQGGAGDE